MQRMKWLPTLVMLWLLAGCSQSTPGSIDYSSNIDFSQIQSYRLAEPEEGQDPLMAKRIADAIRTHLDQRGWQYQEGAAAAVSLYYRSRFEERAKRGGLSIGIGGGRMGSNSSIGGGVTVPVGEDTEQVLILQLDMVKEGQLVWRGTDTLSDTGRYSPSRWDSEIPAVVNGLLAQFPPVKAP
ncbi:DUF4136 domain-containing protein [Ferrimonas gelatinilytica]|uniref:DUF4136 domain-containing protein n=1 Tax=Ferrimonas gelatinilytica TaxID=1255257 RepID=A0ABP9SB43_9GAMM